MRSGIWLCFAPARAGWEVKLGGLGCEFGENRAFSCRFMQFRREAALGADAGLCGATGAREH
jgi:hypothetical protein